ncbi:MAG: hypothetical protein GF372_09255 [Candidatus Marinimicrobia bacterium]|nr:hypothetical protein [Candidatus Neomarinimicrobiota bacterium]
MVSAELWPELSVYFEFYFSGKHHEGIVTPREGYLYLDKLPEKLNYFGLNRLFKIMDVKAGHFETNFGNWHLIRSDNADVQRNPLVGNYIIDANTVEPGVELIFDLNSFYLVAGVSNGTTTGVFEPNRGTGIHGKLGLDIEDKLQLSASVYRVDHSGNPALGCEKCQVSFPDIPGSPVEDPDEEISDGSFSSLFAGNRSGSRYAGVLGDGPDVGTLNVGRGQDVLAWHLDGQFRTGNLRLFGMGGAAYDSDINGSEDGEPEENWYYYGGEIQYDLFDDLYLAARYNQARSTQVAGQDMESVATALQIGGGYWVWDNLLLKVEYVRQAYDDFLPLYNGIPALIFNPEFYGVMAEVTVVF